MDRHTFICTLLELGFEQTNDDTYEMGTIEVVVGRNMAHVAFGDRDAVSGTFSSCMVAICSGYS